MLTPLPQVLIRAHQAL
jgi:chromosome segregation ATPase